MTQRPASLKPPPAPGPGTPPLARIDDRATLERTLLALLPLVRSWLHRLLGPYSALEDATQDALFELSRALPNFEGRSSIETFAHRITVRVAYRYFASNRPGRAVAFDPESSASPGPGPDAALAEREGLELLYRCLAQLAPKRRAAFVLCAIEGLQPHEAAELEGTSHGSMRARYMHARDDLARLLAAAKKGGPR